MSWMDWVLLALVALCAKGCGELLAKQKEILGEIL